MQTILGAGGSIGTELASELTKYSKRIRLVSRNPKKVNKYDELFPADLLNENQVLDAVKDSAVVYLVAGLPYSAKRWEEMWPRVMGNVITACKKHRAKLVFFDNIYLYDPAALGHLTESSPVNPVSRKGKVRAQIVKMLQDEIDNGSIKALIARAPDFYGPGIKNGPLNEAVLNPFLKGKKANWFASVDKLHSFIWTPDAAKATAILGNDDKAYGQVWHLPTAKKPLNLKQIIESIAGELDIKPRYQVVGKTALRIFGLFNPIMREFVEMMYQYDRDYVFDSSKFDSQYKFKTTTYAEGIIKMAKQKA